MRKIYAKKNWKASLSQSAPLINADDAWSSGYNGNGQTICVIDTGINYSHPDLGGCLGSGCKVIGGYNYVDGNSDPMDDHGHGTHVAGIIISGQLISTDGVANGANIVALKAGDDDADYEDEAIRNSLIWCYNNRNTYNISVVSMSIGLFNGWGPCGEDVVDAQINNLYNANIPIIAAAGNDGNMEEVSYPACNSQTISVGSVYDADVGSMSPCTLTWYGFCVWDCEDETTFADKIVCNSNRGSLLDLLAPGCRITSTDINGEYSTHCGTSMSTPMVAGAIALMLDKNSSSNTDPTLTPDEILTILQNTGVPVGSYKRIDVEAALNEVESPCECTLWSTGSCGSGGCNSEQKPQTRTCTPSGCLAESRCVYDEDCVDEGGEVNDCTEAGYEYCIEYTSANCDVSIAINMYENVNDIEWGAVNDAWDPYVIGEYQIGWKDVDADDMYYDVVNPDNDCDYNGCDTGDIVNDIGTMTTVTAPGTASREVLLGHDIEGDWACWTWWYDFEPN